MTQAESFSVNTENRKGQASDKDNKSRPGTLDSEKQKSADRIKQKEPRMRSTHRRRLPDVE